MEDFDKLVTEEWAIVNVKENINESNSRAWSETFAKLILQGKHLRSQLSFNSIPAIVVIKLFIAKLAMNYKNQLYISSSENSGAAGLSRGLDAFGWRHALVSRG